MDSLFWIGIIILIILVVAIVVAIWIFAKRKYNCSTCNKVHVTPEVKYETKNLEGSPLVYFNPSIINASDLFDSENQLEIKANDASDTYKGGDDISQVKDVLHINDSKISIDKNDYIMAMRRSDAYPGNFVNSWACVTFSYVTIIVMTPDFKVKGEMYIPFGDKEGSYEDPRLTAHKGKIYILAAHKVSNGDIFPRIVELLFDGKYLKVIPRNNFLLISQNRLKNNLMEK